MPDREKVIKELHDARRYLEDKEWSDRGASPHIDAINDALALLQEQEDEIAKFCGEVARLAAMLKEQEAEDEPTFDDWTKGEGR